MCLEDEDQFLSPCGSVHCLVLILPFPPVPGWGRDPRDRWLTRRQRRHRKTQMRRPVGFARPLQIFMAVCPWQGERGVAGAPGPPGIAGGKVSYWAAPALTPAVRSGSGPNQRAILVLFLPALFRAISPQTFMDFL